MMLESPGDTVVAISTPLGPSAQALLRFSGPDALAVADGVMKLVDGGPVADLPGFCQRAMTIDWDGLPVHGRVSVFRRPRSFTGEDLVEVTVPGSVPLLAGLLRRMLSTGALRMASPGEFSLRAFLNGKMDLSQVEAVARLIHAGGEAEARAAYRQVGGRLGHRVLETSGAITETLALVEAGIDFPDEDIPAVAPGTLVSRIDAILTSLEDLLSSTALRIPERGALRVALAGYPNAGKSSLLNAITGAPAALVSSQAGTTRDPVRAFSLHRGRRLEWVDLAGLEESAWQLEPGVLGVEDRAHRTAAGEEDEVAAAIQRISARELAVADVALWVADGTASGERAIAGLESLGGKRKLLVVSKSDLLARAARRRWRRRSPGPILVSSRTGEGLGDLLERIGDLAGEEPLAAAGATGVGEAALLVSPLQESRLRECLAALQRARQALLATTGGDLELAAADLRDGLLQLEPLSGREVSGRLLGTIFSQFCVGK